MNLHVLAVSALAALATTIALAWVTRPADDLAVRMARPLNSLVALGAMLPAWAAALSVGTYLGCILILGMYLLVRILKAWFEWRAGGVTGAGLILTLALSAAVSFAILTRLQQLW